MGWNEFVHLYYILCILYYTKSSAKDVNLGKVPHVNFFRVKVLFAYDYVWKILLHHPVIWPHIFLYFSWDFRIYFFNKTAWNAKFVPIVFLNAYKFILCPKKYRTFGQFSLGLSKNKIKFKYGKWKINPTLPQVGGSVILNETL